MFSEFAPDPYFSRPLYEASFFDSLFKDPYAEARAFYGEAVFQRLLAKEKADREWAAVLAKRLPEMIDDISSQVLTN